MKKKSVPENAPFQRIRKAAELTGIPESCIRALVRAGKVKNVRSGRCYLVSVPDLLNGGVIE